MASKPYNVLRVNAVEECNDLRAAVAKVLVNIQQDFGITLHDIAEAINVSLGTISNAANKKCDLSSHFRDRLGEAFGVEVLNPIAALIGGRMVPAGDAQESDAMPPLTGAVHRLAIARSPESEGGVAVTHRELLGMLPDLRAAQRAIGAMIAKAERLAA